MIGWKGVTASVCRCLAWGGGLEKARALKLRMLAMISGGTPCAASFSSSLRGLGAALWGGDGPCMQLTLLPCNICLPLTLWLSTL